MGSWQLQEAKSRLSRIISEAQVGAQIITVRGREAAVVLSIEEFRRLTAPKTSLVAFFRDSPLAEVDLDFKRDADTGREVDL